MTVLPNNLYEIEVYNHEFDLHTALQFWNRLEYSQRINAPWNHFVEIRLGAEHPYLQTIRDIAKDFIFRVFRYDPVSGVKSLVYSGFHNTTVDQINSDGTVIFSLYGSGYATLLNRRLVLPTAGMAHNTRSGPAESVAKGFVEDCFITSEAARQIAGFSIAPDAATGTDVEYKARYIQLHSVIETVCEGGGLDFGVDEGAEIGEFVFDARPLWGLDRTTGNADGNTPVQFSLDFGNMRIPILSTNASDEKNYVYIGGQGQGVDREIVEVYDVDAISASPFGRKELFTDARQEATTDGLEVQGNAKLEERKAKVTLTFDVQQTRSSRWLVHWNLGDLITASYQSYLFNKQIGQITVTVTSGEGGTGNPEIIDVELIDARTQS